MPCLRDEWQWASLSLTVPSGIPGDLQFVFSLAKYRIEIENNSESREGSAIGDFSKDSMEGSSQVELR